MNTDRACSAVIASTLVVMAVLGGGCTNESPPTTAVATPVVQRKHLVRDIIADIDQALKAATTAVAAGA